MNGTAAAAADRPNGDFVVGMSNGDNQTVDPKTGIALGYSLIIHKVFYTKILMKS